MWQIYSLESAGKKKVVRTDAVNALKYDTSNTNNQYCPTGNITFTCCFTHALHCPDVEFENHLDKTLNRLYTSSFPLLTLGLKYYLKLYPNHTMV